MGDFLSVCTFKKISVQSNILEFRLVPPFEYKIRLYNGNQNCVGAFFWEQKNCFDNIYKYSKQSVDDVNIIVILYIIYILYGNTWYSGGFPFSEMDFTKEQRPV